MIHVEPEFGLDRDTFIARLAECGVDCSVHFIPLHHQPYFQRLLATQVKQTFPVADAVFPGIVSLPFHPGLSDAMVDRVCEEIDGIRPSENAGQRRWPAVAS